MKIQDKQSLTGAYYCDHCGNLFHVSCLWAHSQLLIVQEGRSQLFDLCPECVAKMYDKIKTTAATFNIKKEG